MGLEAAGAIAKLASVDYAAAGLSDMGRPEGFLERQVTRWLSELESYARHANYPGPEIPGLEEVAGWLEQNRPALSQPGILHGDYHLANVMYARDSPELVAIVDWEMCTIGDPLLDLGVLISTWPDASGKAVGPMLGVGALGGWPTPAELARHYERISGRDLSHLNWYVVLASFKLGIILEGTHARAFAGKAPKATGDFLHSITLSLFQRARERIECGGSV
jgi:aminoglycoside phosphotransferase (APT) family kinase protein